MLLLSGQSPEKAKDGSEGQSKAAPQFLSKPQRQVGVLKSLVSWLESMASHLGSCFLSLWNPSGGAQMKVKGGTCIDAGLEEASLVRLQKTPKKPPKKHKPSSWWRLPSGMACRAGGHWITIAKGTEQQVDTQLFLCMISSKRHSFLLYRQGN